MVHLLSINKIDSPEDPSDGSHSPVTFSIQEEREDKNCAIEMYEPLQSSLLCPGNSKPGDGMKKSPSIGNFSSKRIPVNMQWKNISLTTNKGDVLLKKLSGALYNGQLTAIMGPSGSGKTSLLNVLSGFTRHKVTGQILVNGANRDMRTFQMLTTYILQDDHILLHLTVREIVSIAASLKIPSRISRREREEAVDDCLRCLGLTNQRNQNASELSGGQRKRLCIAQELVSNPPLIILDEPTSGLDSSSCLQCIQLLKSLAEDGRTVVCTVHQPSSKIFEVFDKLYMLAEGQCIYRGSIENLVPFLSSQGLHCPKYHNPADYVTEIAVGDFGQWTSKLQEAIDKIDNISENSCYVDAPGYGSIQDLKSQSSTLSLIHKNKSSDVEKVTHTGYATSSFNQFKVLFYRNVLCTLREPTNIQLKFLGNCFFSLLLGVMYYGIGNDAAKVYSNSVLLFCTITFLINCAIVPTILTFPLKRPVFERELMNSWYGTGMYYLATTIAELPFQLLYPVISCSIVYWMSGQPNDIVRFGLILASLIIITLVSDSIGQLIGAGCDVQSGIFLASLTSIYIILFCGFFITVSNMPSYLRWMSYSSIGRYAFQSILLITYSMDRPPLLCNRTLPEVCPYQDPSAILKELEMEGELYVDYSVLLGYFLLFRLATYLVLKFRVKRMQ